MADSKCLLLCKPYGLTSGQWTTAIANAKTALNYNSSNTNPSHRLHYAPANTDGTRLILQGEFVDEDITNAGLASILGTTEAEVKNKCRVLPISDALIFYKNQWSAKTQRFVWISDPHIGYTYLNGNYSDVVARVNALSPDAVIITGDMTASAQASEISDFITWKAGFTAPVYFVPGNHDEGSELDVENRTTGQTATWDTWDAQSLMHHFSFALGNYQMIGFEAKIVRYDATDYDKAFVEASEITWLTNELNNLAGKIPIVFCHYHIGIMQTSQLSTIGELLRSYNVKGFFAGHGHNNCISGTSYGMTTIAGPGLWKTYDSQMNANEYGGFCVCDVFANRIEIDFCRGRSPWDSFGKTSTPTASDPNYNPVVVYTT